MKIKNLKDKKGNPIVNTGYAKFGTLGLMDKQRDKNKPHVEVLQKSIEKYGQFRAFSVFKPDSNGIRDVFDANHLKWAQDGNFDVDDYVPIVEVWWIDPNDEKSKRDYLLQTQENQKGWGAYQFIKEQSKHSYGAPYTYLLNKLDKYAIGKKKPITEGTVISAYTGYKRVNQGEPIREGKLEISDNQKEFGNIILDRIEKQMKIDSTGMKGNVWRVLVYEFFKDFSKFSSTEKFLNFFDEFLKFIVHDAINENLPQQDASLISYYEKNKKLHLPNHI